MASHALVHRDICACNPKPSRGRLGSQKKLGNQELGLVSSCRGTPSPMFVSLVNSILCLSHWPTLAFLRSRVSLVVLPCTGSSVCMCCYLHAARPFCCVWCLCASCCLRAAFVCCSFCSVPACSYVLLFQGVHAPAPLCAHVSDSWLSLHWCRVLAACVPVSQTCGIQGNAVLWLCFLGALAEPLRLLKAHWAKGHKHECRCAYQHWCAPSLLVTSERRCRAAACCVLHLYILICISLCFADSVCGKNF